MIIVEGPDGSGKTTLIHELHENFGGDIPIAPKVVASNTKSMVASLKAWVEHNLSQGFQATLFDRHRLISEPIYGSIVRSHFEPGFDDFEWLYLQYYRFYNQCHPLIIYCLPPFETVKKNVNGVWTEQPKDVREQIRKIYSLYVARAAADSASYGALHFDYTSMRAQEIKDHIFRVVKEALRKGDGIHV